MQPQKQQNIIGCFQGKPFNIIVILIYAPATSDKEADQFYEDLEDRLELTSKKKKSCSSLIGIGSLIPSFIGIRVQN